MCIRDRDGTYEGYNFSASYVAQKPSSVVAAEKMNVLYIGCLLYTSDAADERSSVDLGGRRIIKKKTYVTCCGTTYIIKQTRHSTIQEKRDSSKETQKK